MIDLASHILDTKAGRFDPSQFKDEYELALRKLVERKAAGKTIEPPAERSDRGNVIDLMEALRQSVKGGKAAALSTRSDSKKSAPARKRGSKSARSRGRKPKAA
jgi:non-homologous end joining protein Ku